MGGKLENICQNSKNALFDVYEYNRDRKADKQSLKNIDIGHGIKQKQLMNVLEKDLASRRARVASQGIGASNSTDALQKSMANEAYLNMFENDLNRKSQRSDIKNSYRKRRDKKIRDITNDLTGYDNEYSNLLS